MLWKCLHFLHSRVSFICWLIHKCHSWWCSRSWQVLSQCKFCYRQGILFVWNICRVFWHTWWRDWVIWRTSSTDWYFQDNNAVQLCAHCYYPLRFVGTVFQTWKVSKNLSLLQNLLVISPCLLQRFRIRWIKFNLYKLPYILLSHYIFKQAESNMCLRCKVTTLLKTN